MKASKLKPTSMQNFRHSGKYMQHILLTSMLFGTVSYQEAQANCSLNSTTPTNITFTNNSTSTVNVYWVDQNCVERTMTVLAPGSSNTQPTWKSHVWLTRKITDGTRMTETQVVTDPVKVTIADPVPAPTLAASTTTSTTPLLAAAAAAAAIVSPANTPFVDPLPEAPVLTKVTTPDPLPTQGSNPSAVPTGRLVSANVGGVAVATVAIGGFTEAVRPDHQKWTQFGGTSATASGFTGDLFESVEMEVPWNFYPAIDKVPPSKIWTFVEASTGAVAPFRINAQYGTPVIHRIHNALPLDNGGFGINQTSTHLHNGHNASESDGGPVQFYDAGQFKDFHYPNVRAGFASNVLTSTFNGKTVVGDVKETMGFLWFHDHRFDFTAQNVYKGLVSFYTLFSNDILLDTGDENTGLHLPSGKYDVPMVFGDKNFDPATGQLAFDTGNIDGILGDKYTVNGKIQPYFNVQKRKYRFRLLDGGPSRFYELSLSNGANMVQLTTNGNLLPIPITTKNVRIGVAERTDVIVDFTKVAAGSKIYFQNQLEQLDGRGPTGKVLATPTKLVEFRVQAGTVVDNSRIPVGTATVPVLPLPSKNSAVAQSRKLDLGSSNGAWTVNGQFFDPNTITWFPKQNSAEKWTITSGGGWAHPLHIHLEEFQVLSRNGKTALVADDVGRKDVIRVGEAAQGTTGTSTLDWFMQFRDWLGDYPVHCHNVVHEDHAMMTRIQVVP